MTSEKRPPLWGTQQLNIIGIAGDVGVGKTRFVTGIDPKNTLLFDTNRGALNYRSLGFTHIDLRLLATQGDAARPLAIGIYHNLLRVVDTIPAGKYSIIGIDTISGPIEQGLTETVADKFATFGFNSRESFLKGRGLFWTRVKTAESDLLTRIQGLCETLIFTVGLKEEFDRDGNPTGRIIPSGKDTLLEMSDLYLTLDKADNGGPVPSASVDRARTLTALPPRLPKATGATILYYLEHPVDLNNLKPEEKNIHTTAQPITNPFAADLNTAEAARAKALAFAQGE